MVLENMCISIFFLSFSVLFFFLNCCHALHTDHQKSVADPLIAKRLTCLYHHTVPFSPRGFRDDLTMDSLSLD